jgi:hypothetical protein
MRGLDIMKEIKGGNITIFSLKLAGYLMMQNFVLVSMAENSKTNDGKKVFYFKNSEDIKQAIEFFNHNKYKIIKCLQNI